MNIEKLLTIIIPTYNMQEYLHRCLDSLLVRADLMDRLEVLVVNDGSKDNSSAIAHEYEAKYSQTIRVIDKENGNYGSCVNRGLVEAQGKYIKVLDADDWLCTLGDYSYYKTANDEMVMKMASALQQTSLLPFSDRLAHDIVMPSLEDFVSYPRKEYIKYLKYTNKEGKPFVGNIKEWNRSVWRRATRANIIPSFIMNLAYLLVSQPIIRRWINKIISK